MTIDETKVICKKILEMENFDERELAASQLISELHEQEFSDVEPYDKKGVSLLRAYVDGDVDGIILALTGWSMHTLLVRAGLTRDIDGVLSA